MEDRPLRFLYSDARTCSTLGMDERTQRIVKIAVELAEQGGFEAVRLRDVASQAEVALGTLYKRFRSKEDILASALDLEIGKLEEHLQENPAPGETPLDRVWFFFSAITRGLVEKPNFARAVLRATVSGEPEVAEKVLRFHERMTAMVTITLQGVEDEAGLQEDSARTLAYLLQQIWFASLVGWMGGLHDVGTVVEQVRLAADLLLRGFRAQPVG